MGKESTGIGVCSRYYWLVKLGIPTTVFLTGMGQPDE